MQINTGLIFCRLMFLGFFTFEIFRLNKLRCVFKRASLIKQEIEILSVLIFLVIFFCVKFGHFWSKQVKGVHVTNKTDGWTGQNIKYHFFSKSVDLNTKWKYNTYLGYHEEKMLYVTYKRTIRPNGCICRKFHII